MPYEPGRILLVAYPFSDHTGLKLRPALVVSGMRFNQGEDIVVVPLSSRVTPDDPYGFPITSTKPYFRQTGLRQSSSVKWTKPLTISNKVIHRKLGIMPSQLLTEIQDLVKTLFA